MAVDALELRPRNAVALFDAAIRLCATTTGVWALTLPVGALLVAALFQLAETIRLGAPLAAPVALWTFAWVLRALSQGAACHYVEQQVLGTGAPSVVASLKAALKRAPALVIASAWLAALNGILWVFTVGIGFLFVGAHGAGYAVTMRGQGSVLGLYGTCSKLLGPTRHVAPWVRVCGLSQLILWANLFLMTWFFLETVRGLFGFDVTFIERFTSLDNPTWCAALAGLTFALFEPLRAATATLMLIDGRVRQEGLDLIAQVEQLPRRTKLKVASPLLCLALCLALPASAESTLTPSAAEPEAQPAPFDAQAKARSILERPEFQMGPTKKSAASEKQKEEEPGWLARLFKALQKWLDRLFKDNGDSHRRLEPPDSSAAMPGANAVMIVALLLVASVLVFILVRSIKRPPSAHLDESGGLVEESLEGDPMSALSKPPETWAGLADQLAARGEYREAIRHLYLALLARLHRDGVIDYEPTWSNWEYLFSFKGASTLKAAFKELTRRFDFAWYGNLGVDALAYSTFRQVCAPLLAQPSEGAPSHA